MILKTVSFEVKTKTVTLPQPVSLAEQLHSAASGLLETEIRACAPNRLRLRLMGRTHTIIIAIIKTAVVCVCRCEDLLAAE